MLMAGFSKQPANFHCIQELSLGALNIHEYGSPLLPLQFEVISRRKDAQMVSTGVGKMNFQGPEAGMQLEEDQPATSLWSGGIRAATLGRKNGERKKRQK